LSFTSLYLEACVKYITSATFRVRKCDDFIAAAEIPI
jgi:hypothetical protein